MNSPKKQICSLGIALIVSLFTSIQINAKASASRLPFDKAVKTGTLPNGFTYYIRHNEEPKNRVTIYLVNKVGSILEREDQRGLAHFIEHMSFNGTTHFPKNELVNYLEKSGIKFGSDLNAYTNFDETVYQLPLPTDNPELLQNGFQIMRDWAQNATLDSIEIEKERGVILEEKRLHTSANERMFNQYFPILTNGSLYSERIPIGTEEVLKGFKRQVLVDFYKWYRPNLQALIVVGDIDLVATEKTVKEMFCDLKNPSPSPAPPVVKIELTGKNQFFSATDKEITMSAIQLIIKLQQETLKTRDDYKRNLIRTLFNRILSERFSDLSTRPDIPFVRAQSGVGGLIANLDAFSVYIAAQPENIESAFRTVWTEIERMKKFGVTDSELQRAKQAYLMNMESAYNERTKTPSDSYVNEYMRNFLKGEACPGIEFEFSLTRNVISKVSIKDVAEAAARYIAGSNRDVIITGPEKDKDALPTEVQINSWINEINLSNIQPYQSTNIHQGLLNHEPKGRKIVKETVNNTLGITYLTLENGIRITLKPTDFKNDEIKFFGFSQGGTSLYSDSEYQTAANAVQVVTTAGIGDFTLSELQKYLSNKRVGVSPFLSERFEGIRGSASQADLETALQLVYLYFTQPRKDFTVFNGEMEKAKVSLANWGNEPSAVFSDTLSAILSNYNIRRTGPTIAKINSIDPERAFAIYNERFADFSDYNFTFVGSFDPEKIKSAIEKYLGALPSIKRSETARNLGIHIPEGKIDKKVYKGVDDKSTVRLFFSGKYNHSVAENDKLSALAELLTIKLTEKLREEEGGVYGVGASANSAKYPESRYSFVISFGCAPTNVEKLIQATQDVIADLKKIAPLQTDVEKVVNEDLRSMEVQMKTNDFWLNYLVSQQQNNEDIEAVLKYNNRLKAITPEALQSAAIQYLNGDNFAKIVLYPEVLPL